ncbi:hypothetical protein BW425_24450 [Bacillus pseudomycoides]|uniref:Uncharacterized protein n=2 Tax=Bacillus pseudomycoides TaxID=64104 RepID=A0A1Y3M7A3_9BACI|nr:GIY-YIG nuclease family protein [Bacillus pseudomycoides]OUM46298.1 hypothetical protein BW425_24450 [Bacillus pseudomycoides]
MLVFVEWFYTRISALERLLEYEKEFRSYLQEMELDDTYINFLEQKVRRAEKIIIELEEEKGHQSAKITQLNQKLYVASNKQIEYKRAYTKLLTKNVSLIKQISDHNLKIIELEKKLDSCYTNDSKLSFTVREKMCVLVVESKVMCKSLLNMGKLKQKRIEVINNIRNKLGEYESGFLGNNLIFDEEAKDICNKIDYQLNNWTSYYKGYKWIANAKSIEEKDLSEVLTLLENLIFLTRYKRFYISESRIVHIDILYKYLLATTNDLLGYTKHRFQKEIISLKEKFEKEEFIVRRHFPGDVYCYKNHFANLTYNFKLIKTYGNARMLYLFGDHGTGTYKVGVTYNSLLRRFFEAEESYKHKYPNGELKKLKVICNDNAYNLEAYIKKKFLNHRHPLFNSTEWFTLQKNQIVYLLSEEYLQDKEFMNVYNYIFKIKND